MHSLNAPPRPVRPSIFGPHFLPLCLLTIAVIALVAPTFRMYMWYGHEHFYPVAQVRDLCRIWSAQGPFQVPWFPEVCFGQGWPFFTFYAPLSYYVAGALHFIFGLDFGAATRWSFYLSIWLSGALMYALAWRTLARPGWPRARWWALTAALVYTFTPYHPTDLFARVTLSESWAWAALPALLLALESARTRPAAGIVWIALAVTALMLTHNIMAMYGLLLAGAWVLLTMYCGTGVSPVINHGRDARATTWPMISAAGIALGFVLSAFFWLPVMALKRYVLAGAVAHMNGTPEYLRLHAVQWQQLFIERLGKGESIPGWKDDFGIDLGICVLLGLLAALATLPRLRGFERRRLIALLILAAGLIFAMTPLMPWQFAPAMLRYIQFPWRLLLVTALLGSLAWAWAAPALPRWLHPLIIASLAVALGLTGTYRSLFADVPKMSDAGLDEFVAGEERTQVFAGCQQKDYLPLWAQPYLINYRYHEDYPPRPSRIYSAEGSGFQLAQYQHRGAAYDYAYAAGSEVRAVIQVFYFPGWMLWIDGEPAVGRIAPDRETGYVSLRLPPGNHLAELKYELSPIGRTARWISLAGLLGMLIGVLLARRKKFERVKREI